MPKINLLPWREERQKNLQREFQGMLALSGLGGAALAGLLWIYFGQQIETQESRNSMLQQEISTVEKQIVDIEELDKQKNRLLARKKIIDQLQSNRSQMVHMFDSLVRTIPDGVVLTSLRQEGNLITLQGKTQSNARVSEYMRKLENSGWMADPDLQIIQTGEQSAANKGLPSTFILKVSLVTPSITTESEKNKKNISENQNTKSTDAAEVVQTSSASQPQVNSDAAESSNSQDTKLAKEPTIKDDVVTKSSESDAEKKSEAQINSDKKEEVNSVETGVKNKSKDDSVGENKSIPKTTTDTQ